MKLSISRSQVVKGIDTGLWAGGVEKKNAFSPAYGHSPGAGATFSHLGGGISPLIGLPASTPGFL